ncbi:MAG: SdrD B-like domain-containing protein [Clostridia bacterium]|nr:SdrD B-like domain-containing protein [Clostridia bacterium]
MASYAAEINLNTQDKNTNINDVKFDVYLDNNDKTKKEISKEINSEDLNLYMSVSVQGKGRLENAKLEFSNSNFELKDNSTIFEKELESISSQKGITIELPIVARKNSQYDLSLLNMVSEIKLSGEYTDNNGNVTDIQTTKMVKINWTTDEITEANSLLTQEIITNKTYKINGVNKRIIQVLVKSNIQENIAPVKSTKLEIQNPQIGVNPETVKVSLYNTFATNGKSALEFGNVETSKWEYNEEDEKVYIEILNNPTTENKVSWQKNCEDEIIVTYIYEENTQILPFSTEAKSTIELYGRTAEAIQQTNKLEIENIEEKETIFDLQNEITQRIYKGNMYIGEDTNYKTRYNLFVSYADLNSKMIIQDLGDVSDSQDVITNYKTTKINKAQAIDILGTDGTIKIYNAEDVTTTLAEIALSAETEEQYLTYTYEENINKIIIETTQPIKEGKLEITNEKSIKVLNIENISEITKIESKAKLIATDLENNIILSLEKTASSNLLEPTTTYSVNLDKTQISNQSENDLRLTAVLESNNISNKLFKNPIINIELPTEITDIFIENISLLYQNELAIKSSQIITNENGNKVIVIELEGEQIKYNEGSINGVNIVIDLKVVANPFMADKNVEIKTTCINNGETTNFLNNLNIISKEGLVTKNSIKMGEEVIEKVNQNNITITNNNNEEAEISSTIINNNGEKIDNINILGTIPQGVNLKSRVTTNLENAAMYYSEEENATPESNTWVNAVESYNNIKAFKIVAEEMEQEEVAEINYNIFENEESKESEASLDNVLKMKYNVNGQSKEEKATFTLNNTMGNRDLLTSTQNSDLEVNVQTTVGGKSFTDNTIMNGQILRYKIEITNKSNQTINNITTTATIENGVFYGLVEDGGEILDIETEEWVKTHSYGEMNGEAYKEFAIEKIEANKTIEIEYQVITKLGQGENANKFKNNILIEANGIEDIAINDEKRIAEGDLALRLHYTSNEEPVLYSNSGNIFTIELINLTEDSLTNIPVNVTLPEGIIYDVKAQQSEIENEEGININFKDNKLNINVEEIEASKTKEVYIFLRTKSIDLTKLENEITLIATANIKDKTYYSNEYIRTMFQSETQLEAEFTSNKVNETLYLDDTIIYTLKLKNAGLVETGALDIFNKIPAELNVTSIVAQVNDEDAKEYEVDEEGNIYIDDLNLKANDSLTLTITAMLDAIINDNPKITNTISISASAVNKIEKKLTNQVKIDNSDSTSNPDSSETYSISGLAWLDENKNGTRDNKEKVMQSIKVILLDKQGNPVIGEDEEEITTITSPTGTYKFNNIAQGDYLVVFNYDVNKYSVTKYKTEGVDEQINSDVISKQLTLNDKIELVGVTDTINVLDKDITNIDIGLIENNKFDLSLNKYISKVVVTNKTGTTTYNFEETNFTKIEISAKQLEGSVVLIEYDIKVSNEGDIDGYVSDITDYIPKDLTFNSEANPDWYISSDGYLHNLSLTQEAILPEQSKTVKLILTKTLKSDSTGAIENTAEIGASTNLKGIDDLDSIEGNKKDGEDDISKATLIVSIKTGGPMMYIGIVLGSMIIMGLGIYIINKKVLERRV